MWRWALASWNCFTVFTSVVNLHSAQCTPWNPVHWWCFRNPGCWVRYGWYGWAWPQFIWLTRNCCHCNKQITAKVCPVSLCQRAPSSGHAILIFGCWEYKRKQTNGCNSFHPSTFQPPWFVSFQPPKLYPFSPRRALFSPPNLTLFIPHYNFSLVEKHWKWKWKWAWNVGSTWANNPSPVRNERCQVGAQRARGKLTPL